MAVSDKVQTMTIEAGKRLLDQEARKYLGVSGDEFLSAWDKGAYEGKADTPEVMRLVEIIPFVR
jgi:hypothetical protein